jgi:hypothetical protein
MLKTLILKLAPSYIPNLIRQAGLIAGGALVTNGWADAAMAEQVSGAIMIFLSAGWALVEKRKLLDKLFA